MLLSALDVKVNLLQIVCADYILPKGGQRWDDLSSMSSILFTVLQSDFSRSCMLENVFSLTKV